MRLLKSTLVLVISIFIALLIGELALRFLNIEYPLIYKGDRDRGAALAPGVAGWIRTEGASFVKINSQGLRDREHTETKPDGVYRIAVLGDSYAEAVHVDMTDTFWSRLERNLSKCPVFADHQIEVINLGVSGYGTAQELITLRRHVWKYSPDMVLLAFFQGNDVEDNSRSLTDRIYRPFFNLKDDKLIKDVSFRDSEYYAKSMSTWVGIKNNIINRVRLLQLLYHVKENLKNKDEGADVRKPETREIKMEKGLSPSIYNEPKTPAWIEAWNITEKLILEMDREVRGKGSTFVLTTLSISQQVYPDKDVTANFKKQMKISNLFYPDDRLERFAKKNRINVLKLAPRMQAFAQENNVFLHGFNNTVMGKGHWNEAGHKLAAQLISRDICEDLGSEVLFQDR